MTTFPISKILVPVDFSPKSADAAQYAQRVATHFGSELIFMHVIPPLNIDFAMSDPSRVLMLDFTADRRKELLQQLDEFGPESSAGVSLRRLVLDGEPADRIVEFAYKEGVGLIVMPTQGRNRVRRFLIGSVTAKVLHDSEVPVLTGVHLEQTPDFPDFRVDNLLCAVDLGPQSVAVVKMAKALAQEFHARTTVLHVAPHGGDSEHKIAELINAAGLEADVQIVSGEPHKVVAETAARLKSDLIIIGRGSSNTMIGRLRAQAYAIVRQSPCPVLSV